jgi:YHS domain-containing protein
MAPGALSIQLNPRQSAFIRVSTQRYHLLRRPAMAKDPVCGMMVDEKKAAGKSEYQGKTYYFCAAACKAKFDANPGDYIDKR